MNISRKRTLLKTAMFFNMVFVCFAFLSNVLFISVKNTIVSFFMLQYNIDFSWLFYILIFAFFVLMCFELFVYFFIKNKIVLDAECLLKSTTKMVIVGVLDFFINPLSAVILLVATLTSSDNLPPIVDLVKAKKIKIVTKQQKVEHKKLKHMRKKGLISEENYQRQKNKINNKYKNEKKKVKDE